MDTCPWPADCSTDTELPRERRKKLRIREPFLAKVRGANKSGKDFEIETNIENLSSEGLYVRFEHQVDEGARLFIIIRLPADRTGAISGPIVATRGLVKRCESIVDGTYGLAVNFTSYRFI